MQARGAPLCEMGSWFGPLFRKCDVYFCVWCVVACSDNGSVVCEESALRERVYWENKRFIEEYNTRHSSHQLGINAFADLTSNEF